MKILDPKYVHTISILRENSMSIFRKQLSNNATIFLLAVIADFVLLSPLFSNFLPAIVMKRITHKKQQEIQIMPVLI